MTEKKSITLDFLTLQKKNEHHLIARRREKLNRKKENGQVIYPNNFFPNVKISNLHYSYNSKHDKKFSEEVKISGRIMLKRIMGKASFATVQDSTGKIQLYLEIGMLGFQPYSDFKQLDIGDIVGVEGSLFLTNRGELSLRVSSIYLLCKALRPFPEKFHGLTDQELRYRERYIDLIMNENSRQTFKKRSEALAYIRKFMSDADFIEVETPMLHTIPGGALAKPFSTYHNSLNMEMFLRIAPELYLKRLIIGGFERVFEINRSFRNEGISPNHNPEFTMMEFYAAYTDYHWMMDFTESLIEKLAINTVGNSCFTYQNRKLDLSKPFKRLSISEAILNYSDKYKISQIEDVFFLVHEIRKIKPDFDDSGEDPSNEKSLAKMQLLLFEELISQNIWDPTYVTGYPVEMSPLARTSDKFQNTTERFELFIAGREIANGFSELNDPEDQASRFLSQIKSKDSNKCKERSKYYDADYIRALEYGLPPSGGCGIGIDRLIMLITNKSNIRDVILFPHLRKEKIEII